MNTNNTTKTTIPAHMDCGESTPLSLLPPNLPPTQTPGPRGSTVSPSAPKPKFIDTWDIPFPKTMDELHALDATREIPCLKALCTRRFIPTPGPNPTPAQIIPIIEQTLIAHRARRPQTLSQHADIFVEWKLNLQDLEEFLTNLRSLLPCGSRGNEAPTKLTPSTQFTPSPSPIEATQREKIANQNSGHDAPPLQVGEGRGEGPSFTSSTANPSSTPRHFQDPNPPSSKTPAISNPRPGDPKTFGHSQDSSQKNSSTSRPRRIPDLIATLSPETKETLIAYCEECSTYQEAAQKIQEHLGLKISPSRLCKHYTNYGIADDQQTRAEIIAAHEEQNETPLPRAEIIRATAKEQLELRLLELSARRDHDPRPLKELFQIITRLEALALSERRVVVAERRIALAEKRDQRETQPEPPKPSLSPLEIKRRVRVSLGKSTDDIDAEIARQAAASQAAPSAPNEPAPETPAHIDSAEDRDKMIARYTKILLGKEITLGDETPINNSCRNRREEILTNSAPTAHSNPSLQPNPAKIALTEPPNAT